MEVGVGLIGLGNVGSGTLQILCESSKRIQEKLGFPLSLKAICARSFENKQLPEVDASVLRTTDWREVFHHPDMDIVVEVVGGAGVAAQIIEAALRRGKSVVTANKELMALRGAELWNAANAAGVNIAMEASVAGGIPIHTVLREGIAGDWVTALYGILNGTSNFILTEIEKTNAAFEAVLAEAQTARICGSRPKAPMSTALMRAQNSLYLRPWLSERG